jgi:hypothetical protein
VWSVFEAERPLLVPYAGRFDGFHASPAAVSKTCRVRFDTNKDSVMAKAVGRPVEIRAYADRVTIWQDGEVVGEHARRFGRNQTVYDPWHYVPVLARKPGALRNGAPFRGGSCHTPSSGCAGGSPAAPDGRHPRRGAERRLGRRRGRLRGRARGRHLLGRRHPQSPGADPPAGIVAACHPHPGQPGSQPCPHRRLLALRCAAGEPMMGRRELLDMMGRLQLAGMRAAFDEVLATGLKRKHAVQQILANLLKAEIADKQARSIRYQLAAARQPPGQGAGRVDFACTPINEALVRSLATGAFLDQQRNLVLVGGQDPPRRGDRPRLHPRRTPQPLLQRRRSRQQARGRGPRRPAGRIAD